MNTCLFCDQPEPCKHYVPPAGVSYVCSACVVRLLRVSQDHIRAAHKKAVEIGANRKAEALKSFMEDDNEQRNPKSRKPYHRANVVRTVRMHEKSTLTIPKRGAPSVFEHRQEPAVVPGSGRHDVVTVAP